MVPTQQMLMPQQRWVQVTLAVAKLSALMATALWSHDDAAAVTKMNSILAEDGLTPPKLQLAAKATPREANSDSSEVAAGQHQRQRHVLHCGHRRHEVV